MRVYSFGTYTFFLVEEKTSTIRDKKKKYVLTWVETNDQKLIIYEIFLSEAFR